MVRQTAGLTCVLVLFGATTVTPALAADYYLKIEGVEGDSSNQGHEKWLRGTSNQWLTLDGAAASGPDPSSPGRIKIKFPSLPKTTPLLMRALSTNYVYGEVLLDVVEAAGSSSARTPPSRRFVLQRAQVVAYTPGSGLRSSDELTLSYERIRSEAAPPALRAPGGAPQ
jgi:type VI protein secretion system component Hcp